MFMELLMTSPDRFDASLLREFLRRHDLRISHRVRDDDLPVGDLLPWRRTSNGGLLPMWDSRRDLLDEVDRLVRLDPFAVVCVVEVERFNDLRHQPLVLHGMLE